MNKPRARSVLSYLAGLFRASAPRAAAPVDPRILAIHRNIQSGQLQQAQEACRILLKAEPDNAEIHHALGQIAFKTGSADLAVRHFSRAVEFDSRSPKFHQALGMALFGGGNLAEATHQLELAVRLAPKDPAGHNGLGNCYRARGDLALAARCYRKAIALDPANVSAHINLGAVLKQQGDLEGAIEAYRKTLKLASTEPGAQLLHAHNDLALALIVTGELTEAISHCQRAIALDPNFAVAHNSLGLILAARCDFDGALASFRQALAIKPDFARAHSNLLMIMNYPSASSQRQLYSEAVKFDAAQAVRLRNREATRHDAPDTDRTLRVGYVSPDFRHHSVAYFTKNLLGEHDRERFEVYCYADVAVPDGLTGRFQAQADQWLSTTLWPDARVAARVREDRIDILVDLAGHTADNRLLVFAHKPAPVQVTWLGYPNTTGMRAIDYRLTDSVADPPGEADKLHTEKLIRLEPGFLCYQPDEAVPEVSSPPFVTQGHVTFGSLNTLKKVTPEVVRIWAQILESVPDARLLLKSMELDDDVTRKRILHLFGQHGIPAARLELLGWIPGSKEHMELYSHVDIGLDPFPYNGTTTTCEALWMGVPVICLRGDRHAARVGASIMQHAGLPELVAGSEEAYVALARGLAGDRERLAAMRRGLRGQMQRSELMDLQRFTEALENAYREMWVTWCRQRR